MLLRPDATFIDQATKRAERVFPRGTEWLHFESKFPAKSVFENSVLDPQVGVSGELGMKTFASADWQNWISTTKISLYEIGTRIGLPKLEGTGLASGLGLVYENIAGTVQLLERFEDPGELVKELLKNAGMQVIEQLSQGNMVGQTVAQVLAAAVWAIDVVAAHKQSELGKNIALPPLQSEDPATDSWQVNRVFEVFRSAGVGGVAYPDGKVEPASNADYTNLYLPAYQYNQGWIVQHRSSGIAMQQGHPQKARGPTGDSQYNFDPGDGSNFGFVPGTTTTLRVLQASYRFYSTVRGTPVDRYTIRCRGVDEPCYKTVKAFDGSRDCRQCVKAESVWPTEGIGWAYGGVPLNATTPGENVGAFYPSTNKLLHGLLEQIAKPGPLLYTIDVEKIDQQWKKSFELFWEAMHREWGRYWGPGWRGLLSRIATLMTVFEADGEVQLGGRDPDMPAKLIAKPTDSTFSIPFAESLYTRIIRPYCVALSHVQLRYLDALEVAYIPPGAGALYYANGKIRKNALGDHFIGARKQLLNSTKRMLVDLRQVSDPEYRAELKAAGVKPSPVNPLLHGSVGVGDSTELLTPQDKPPRRVRKPKVVRVSPLAASVKLARRAPPARTSPPARGPQLGDTGEQSPRTGVAVGVTAAAAAVATATVIGLDRLSKPRS